MDDHRPMNKTRIYQLLRNTYLINLADEILLFIDILKNIKQNAEFRKNHHDVIVPPHRLAFDAYGSCNYQHYYNSGLDLAKLLDGLIRKKTNNRLVICEWGCGPARILPHFLHIDQGVDEVIGTDYNEQTIHWCKEKFPNIKFIANKLSSPLDLPTHSVDVLYCVSVFTHLSESQHYIWRDEIIRVLKPGGLFIGTFHGEKCQGHLLPDELKIFQGGGLVVRGRIKEGRKHFLAYQSDKFMAKFLSNFENMEKLETPMIIQTIWSGQTAQKQSTAT